MAHLNEVVCSRRFLPCLRHRVANPAFRVPVTATVRHADDREADAGSATRLPGRHERTHVTVQSGGEALNVGARANGAPCCCPSPPDSAAPSSSQGRRGRNSASGLVPKREFNGQQPCSGVNEPALVTSRAPDFGRRTIADIERSVLSVEDRVVAPTSAEALTGEHILVVRRSALM